MMALIVKNAHEKQIQKLDIYDKGYLYLQSLSSMIPPILLNPKPGEKVGEECKEQFDKVLLDAPCSGEGRFLGTNVGTYRSWSAKTVKELAKLQRKLLKSAYQALKPDGVMVYSTCTLNKKENEEVLQLAIENLNLKLLDIDMDLKEKMQGFSEGLDKSINKAIRILP